MSLSLSRRSFLGRAGASALGLSVLPRCEFNDVRLKEGVGGLVDLPFLSPAKPGEDLVVSEPAFHYRQFGGRGLIRDWEPPAVDQDGWSLTIDGFVDTPQALSFGDLMAESSSALSVVKTLRCVIDTPTFPGLIGNAIYTGIPLTRVLSRAGVDASRTERFYFTGADGFSNNLLLDEVLGDFSGSDLVEPLLVYEMNGAPLHPLHGAPVRLLVPGKFGYKNIKSIVRIEAGEDSNDPARQGTYQQAGFVDDGNVLPMNKVTNPLNRQTVTAGAVTIFGFALSGAAGIDRVEISIDGGVFESAELVPKDDLLAEAPELGDTVQFTDAGRFPYPFRDVWTFYRLDTTLAAGPHQVVGRATDRAGNQQAPEDERGLIDGANGWFRLEVTAEG